MKVCNQAGIGIMVLLLVTFFSGFAAAGDLAPPSDAVDASGDPVATMVTLDEIHSLVENINALVDTGGLEQTGQTTSYATGDDGDLQKGNALPDPRFCENGDGTVTDNLTGLVWLQDANKGDGKMTWEDALTYCSSLEADSSELTDDSVAGDWRLPNIKELLSLVDYSQSNPVLPSGHPFTNVKELGRYWSSSTDAADSGSAWYVHMEDGDSDDKNKANNSFYVWPVRDGN
jgi:hypothetical protein